VRTPAETADGGERLIPGLDPQKTKKQTKTVLCEFEESALKLSMLEFADLGGGAPTWTMSESPVGWSLHPPPPPGLLGRDSSKSSFFEGLQEMKAMDHRRFYRYSLGRDTLTAVHRRTLSGKPKREVFILEAAVVEIDQIINRATTIQLPNVLRVVLFSGAILGCSREDRAKKKKKKKKKKKNTKKKKKEIKKERKESNKLKKNN